MKYFIKRFFLQIEVIRPHCCIAIRNENIKTPRIIFLKNHKIDFKSHKKVNTTIIYTLC